MFGPLSVQNARIVCMKLCMLQFHAKTFASCIVAFTYQFILCIVFYVVLNYIQFVMF